MAVGKLVEEVLDAVRTGASNDLLDLYWWAAKGHPVAAEDRESVMFARELVSDPRCLLEAGFRLADAIAPEGEPEPEPELDGGLWPPAC